MNSAEQASGEKRVRERLVDPLLRLGMGRPARQTQATFEAMLNEVCAKLAYMSDNNLEALEEVLRGLGSGPGRDRFPSALVILPEAARIQPPGDDASPLIRAVFAHEVGQRAINEGWAPELLAHLRTNRAWPGGFALKTVIEAAGPELRRLNNLEMTLSRGGDLTREDSIWRERRLARLARCREIGALTARGAA